VVVPVRAGEDAAPDDDELEGDGVDEADEDRLVVCRGAVVTGDHRGNHEMTRR